MHRHNHSHNQSQGSLPRGRPVLAEESALASECFEQFLTASTLKTILGSYRNICEYLHLKPNVLPLFYPKLKTNINSWKAKPLWKKFDTRANQKCYARGKASPNTRVLIIGAGPCGLRTAIEAQLLGAKVVVVEKRDRMSRNNVLHLWPFVIDDLRALGAKKFFGKFCAGSIDHISIRQLQCILLKVALLLGVEIHTEVSFEGILEPNPNEKNGWRAEFKPSDHPVSQFEFDVIIGADGKRNTLQGFKRKEFRGKLAIAITANFINKRTEAEARVEEISGVAFIFNQKFFKDLYAETGIDLENIVYYKDDTHYFVMTAKKQSLIDKGVIREDLSDTAKLLAPDNVDREELMNYAREAAEFSTNYQMPDLEFAVNHYGQPDVAMFDFTSMYAAENASRVIERHNYKLLSILVGDSLLEPFWPTGSGCARGFLSSMDAAWAIRSWGSEASTPLEVMAERESIYRLLAQTTPENLNKDYKSYTIDPSSRYPNLNKNALLPHQVTSLYDTDDPKSIELMSRPAAPAAVEVPKKRRRRESHVDPETLLSWIKEQIREHEDLDVQNLTLNFRDGRVLCAIISHYRPDLLDYSAINAHDHSRNNQVAFDLLEKELGVPPPMTGEEMANSESPDYATMLSYLTKVYDTFRCEIPHIKYPKWEPKLTITRTSVVVLPPSSYPLKPLLITPNSSAKASDETLQEESSQQFSAIIEAGESGSSFKPPLSDNNLILVPIVSIENYLARDNNMDRKSGKVAPLEKVYSLTRCRSSKSDPLVPANRKSAMKMKTNGGKSVKSKMSSIVNIRNRRNRVSQRIAPLKSEEFSKSQFGDHNHDVKYAGKAKINKTKQKLDRSNDVQSSMEGSAQITINFLREMDSFLQKQNDLRAPIRHNLKVKIQRRDHQSFPKEIPQFLLKETIKDSEKHTDEPAPDIIIKNYERKGDDMIAMQVVKFSPITNCLSIIPKMISTMSSGLFGRYPSDSNNNNKESCQILPVESHARVEGWIKTSNFDSDDTVISEYNTPLKPSVESTMKIVENDAKSAGKLKADPAKKTVLNQSTVPIEAEVQDATNKTQNTTSTVNSYESVESMTKLMETLKSSTNIKGVPKTGALSSSWELYQGRTKSKSEPPDQFSTIIEAEESDMPEIKRNEKVLKVRSANAPDGAADIFAASAPPSRPSSRHKRHAIDASSFLNKPGNTLSQDRKARKRKTLEKVGASVEDRQKRLEDIVSNRTDRHNKRRQQRKMQTEQFVKSMQMLHSNCKPDHSEPFEDYSIYLYRQTAPNFEDRVKNLEKQFIYVPDKDAKAGPAQGKREADEDFAARIKDMEEKWREPVSVEKKPKDLLRAIGKIETSDWNIKEIEKKIIENKLGKAVNKDKEKVPKWSREQFLARQTKMERQHLDRQNSGEVKFAEIDKNIKQLELKLKEGSVRDLNQQKVASITEKFVGKTGEAAASQSPPPPAPVSKPVQKSNSRPVIPIQSSEYCHFCAKRVYLVERLTAEGKVFHTGCFRCQYCHTSLRLGTYTFDREGLYGHRFYCAQHFGLPGQISRPEKKPTEPVDEVPQKKVASVLGVDLLDRVQTPERIEFSNLSTGHVSSDHEESLSPIDEDEWTDRNNINSVVDTDSSDDSSSASDTDTDDEAYEEALEEPVTKEGTLRWAERYKKRYSHKRNDSNSDGYSSSDHSSYYENSSEEDESDTATEGEEEIRARELRKQEVRVEPPIDAGTDTEIASCDTTSESSSEILNSATEISTDSEFAHDDPTPTREAPPRKIFDGFVTKTRGTYGHRHQQQQQQQPKRVQVKSSVLQQPMNGRAAAQAQRDIELKFTPLVATPIVRKPAPSSLLLSRNEGYALNRTQSTGGIATKVSLELKKKYLLGEPKPTGGIQKSGSASTLDSKFKSFHTNISDCQKLLRPAPEVSASMQAFCSKLSERTSPLSPTFGSTSLYTKENLEKSISASSVPEIIEAKVVNETEGRPRSPVHEKQLIVPVIDWVKTKQKQKSDFIDSLSSDDSDSDDGRVVQKANNRITNIPRLEIHDDSGTIVQDDIAYDSLNVNVDYNNSNNRSSSNDTPKSISSEKKTLNQPKILPDLSNDSVLPELHSALHTKRKSLDSSNKALDEKSSGRSSPSIIDDQNTTALTETELDDFEDVEYELISDIHALHSSEERIEIIKSDVKPQNVTECVNLLNLNIDNIEFMDTGTEETSSDDNAASKNNGYVQFRNEEDFAEDSLSPTFDVMETVNPLIKTFNFNKDTTGDDNIKKESSQTDNADIPDKLTMKIDSAKQICDNNEDIVETGTTTEENTCSDSTVKNITEKITMETAATPVNSAPVPTSSNQDDSTEFQEHCQRLQSKIEFSNVKDSLDIKRTRRKSKPEISKPDLIQEEKDKSLSVAKAEEMVITTSPKLSKKEEIEKERSINQKLVQEMVMNKMRAQNKSLERKKRPRNSFSPIRPFELAKSATTTDFTPKNTESQTLHSPTPDVLLSTIPNPLQKSQSTVLTLIDTNIPLENDDKSQKNHLLPDVSRTNEVFATPKNPVRIENEEAKKTVEKIKQNARARCKLLSDEELGLSPEDKILKLREMAAQKRNKDPDAMESIDVHIQDDIESLVINTDRRNSLFYSNDTLKRNTSFRRSKSGEAKYSTVTNNDPWKSGLTLAYENDLRPVRTKSVIEISKFAHTSTVDLNDDDINENKVNMCKSDPNLLIPNKKQKKHHKDRERRKSITKLIAELFSKKKDSSPSNAGGATKGFLSRISPKSKNKSKEKLEDTSLRRNSISEMNLRRDMEGGASPPPVPPLPMNYVRRNSLKDESSEAENEYRHEMGSSEALDHTEAHTSFSNCGSRRMSRGSRKTARQAQLKRHRMAQELQRKLEEIEVKTRELEDRGVQVEKALRGESTATSGFDDSKDESDLLKEWFDLMRRRTELRRYEKELTIRAQEVELEDRHARLQHELRERLENNEPKTSEEMEIEGDIIKEMMEIVAKRDTLINLLEEDRLRYFEEDRDFEEQILTKGIHLTSLVQSTNEK